MDDNSLMPPRQNMAGPGAALVSAVIPAFNTERYLRRAIESVLAQRYGPVECIVVDDGSTDRSGEIARSFGNRVRYIAQANGGASAARNTGIHAARGEYIAFLDADDYWLDTKLEHQMRVFAAHPGLRLVSAHWTWLPSTTDPAITDFKGPQFDATALSVLPGWESLLRDPYLCTPTVVVPTAVARAVGGFDTTLPSAEDVDFFLRACDGNSYARLRQPLVGCQLRPGSLTRTASSHRHNLDVLARIGESRPELSQRYGTVLMKSRLDIYQRWASTRVFHGNGPGARVVLRESRAVGKLPGYQRLWLKSYLASALKAVRDRLRPLAREDQALS
ncbi:MAG: glycosyltransferase family 2 protein [Sphaerotilus sp.]|nr:glycosyltransferase family 2 protein [Sphaerotilus sp.]